MDRFLNYRRRGPVIYLRDHMVNSDPYAQYADVIDLFI